MVACKSGTPQVHSSCLVATYEKHFAIYSCGRKKSQSLVQVKFGKLGTKNISFSTLGFFMKETL